MKVLRGPGGRAVPRRDPGARLDQGAGGTDRYPDVGGVGGRCPPPGQPPVAGVGGARGRHLVGEASAELDLTEPAGRTRLEELLSSADLLVQGYRPGALARFGLTQEALAQRHPHLSVVTLSAWGPEGPWSQRRGFDSLVQCVTGIALTEGSSDRPGWLPAQVLDHTTGYLAAAAGLLALASAQQDGRPRAVQLSLAQTARWLVDGGSAEAEDPRPVDVERYRIVLPGPRARVEVIAPPGRLGDLIPSWTFTTDAGADPPAFPPAALR